MNFRSLWPWLLTGALLASAFANLSMYREIAGTVGEKSSLASLDTSATSAHHFASGSLGEHCPTLDLLGLTDEQRRRIRTCSLTSLDARTDLAIEINNASAELDDLLSQDAMEGGARILALADRISSLRSEQYKALIGSILVIREVLTPEQLQLLHELES